MAKDAETIIAARNKAAAKSMSGQSVADRMVSEPGLAFANGWDRTKSALKLDSNLSVFLRAAALGAMRGAFYGLLLGIACVGVLSFSTIAAPAFLFPVLMGGGALLFGMHDGQRRLEYHLYSGHKTFSDWVARKTGAVGKSHAHTPAPPPPTPEIKEEAPDLNPDARIGHVARIEEMRSRHHHGEELSARR